MPTSSPHLRRPIFVVGYMHSGTTLLLNVLSRHPDVFGPDHETKYFMHLDLVRRHVGVAGGDLSSAAHSFARSVVDTGFPLFDKPRGPAARLSDRDAGEAFRSAMDDAARSAGCHRWVEKTPTHIFHVAQIADAIPDATFIEMVRDPRDVIASKKTRTASVWTSERYEPQDRARKHLEKSFDPFWDSLSWKSAVQAGAAAQRATNWMRIRYEDLVDDPRSVVVEVCESLDLTFHPSLLDVDRGVPADPAELKNVHLGIAESSMERWRTVLDPIEVAICERVGHREMEALGYGLQGSVGGGPVLLRLILRSVPALFVRLYRQFRLGGRAYFVEVLKGLADRLRVIVRH